jgi:hypothetical protein
MDRPGIEPGPPPEPWHGHCCWFTVTVITAESYVVPFLVMNKSRLRRKLADTALCMVGQSLGDGGYGPTADLLGK